MSCSAGFYISAGNCQLADQLCATFDSSNGNCLSCYDGYRLNIGKCYLNNPILNCKMFNGSICSVCEDNYYVGKDGSCIRSWSFFCYYLLNNIFRDILNYFFVKYHLDHRISRISFLGLLSHRQSGNIIVSWLNVLKIVGSSLFFLRIRRYFAIQISIHHLRIKDSCFKPFRNPATLPLVC